MTIVAPGIYSIPLAEYIADPAPEPSLNAGTAHRILEESPRHAWEQHPRLNPNYRHEESSRLDLGTIAHALLLEHDDSRVVVIDAEDWRTKVAKEERDTARALGKLPILKGLYEDAKEMVSVARREIAASELAEAFEEAIPEQTLIWEHDGIWCRSRPDKATKDWRVLFDYKTCAGSGHPAAWGRKAILQHGYDLQALLGIEGAHHLSDPQDCTFVFIVQEIEKPYAVSFVSLSPAWIHLAQAKLQMAMSIWKGCLRTNEWPGYAQRVAYLEPPVYATVGWDDHLSPINAEDFVS